VHKLLSLLDYWTGRLFGLIGLVFAALFVFGMTMLFITIIGIAYGVIKGLLL
jgi:membrane-bound ClpP family serine protease